MSYEINKKIDKSLSSFGFETSKFDILVNNASKCMFFFAQDSKKNPHSFYNDYYIL